MRVVPTPPRGPSSHCYPHGGRHASRGRVARRSLVSAPKVERDKGSIEWSSWIGYPRTGASATGQGGTRRRRSMLIRVGYELLFDVPAPVPMLLMLDLHPDRESTVRRFGGMRIEPF